MDRKANEYIRLAEEAIANHNYDQAKILLQQSLQYHPTTKAKQLLTQLMNTPDNDNKLVDDTLAKTDYYDILGVSKTATEDEIKKRYKKLALKLHPDKNRSKQAAEAFKKLAQAFSCLSNKERRQEYDNQSNMHYEDNINPNDIFDKAAYWEDEEQYEEQYEDRHEEHGDVYNGTNGSSYFWQVTVLLLAIGLVFVLKREGYFSWQSERDYSFTKTSTCKYYRITQTAGVEYYVSKKFDEEYSRASELRRVEDEIELRYLDILWKECSEAKDKKGKLEKEKFYAHNSQKEDIEQKIQQLNLPSCGLYTKIKRRITESNI